MGLGSPVGDAELVASVLDGDMDAFSALYRAHAGAVHTVVRDNVCDPDGVSDVIQEVFTRALERLVTLRDPSRFRPWLLSIARHTAVDARRHRLRVDVRDDNHFDRTPSASTGPDELAEIDELARLVRGGVAGLAPRDATALSLVTHLGFTPSEVAKALGVTSGAAKVIVHRARRRLHDALALQLLVRCRWGGCADFRDALEEDDLVAAARHVRSCAACDEAAASEVALFDFSSLIGSASMDVVTDARVGSGGRQK